MKTFWQVLTKVNTNHIIQQSHTSFIIKQRWVNIKKNRYVGVLFINCPNLEVIKIFQIGEQINCPPDNGIFYKEGKRLLTLKTSARNATEHLKVSMKQSHTGCHNILYLKMSSQQTITNKIIEYQLLADEGAGR